jgi:hypothetical protein
MAVDMATRDLKYCAVVLGDRTWKVQVTDLAMIRSDALRPVIHAFVENVLRTNSAAITPAQIAWKVRRDQFLADRAIFNATGKLGSDLTQLEQAFEVGHEYRQEFESLADNFFSRLTSPSQNAQMLLKYGIGYVEILIQESKGIQSAMEALLASLVLESWTMFESLASDLWVVGVDEGPGEIVARINVASQKAFKQPEDNIRPETVHEIGIDARAHYGSFLREIGKVTFQRLRDIQFYYGIAFGKDASKLFDEVANGYIFALSAFRNALTHNAGKADKHFVKQVGRFEELRGIKTNDLLLLDGELVKKLQQASQALAVRLIQFVDDVLNRPNS